MQSTFLSLPNLHQASSLPLVGGALPYLPYKRMCHFPRCVLSLWDWELPLTECDDLQWAVLSSVLFYTNSNLNKKTELFSQYFSNATHTW